MSIFDQVLEVDTGDGHFLQANAERTGPDRVNLGLWDASVCVDFCNVTTLGLRRLAAFLGAVADEMERGN